MALLNTNIGPERVQVFDVPLGTVQVPGAGTSTAAFVISTDAGGAPVDTVVTITSLSDFEDSFGDADNAGQGFYAVKGYYDNVGTGVTAYVVNVGTTPTSTDYIGDAAAGTGIRAFDDIDDIGMVCVPGLALPDAYLVQPSLIDYTETIRAEFGSTLSTSFSLMTIPKEINKSNSDTTLLTAQLTSITGTGPYVMDIQLLNTAVAATGTYTVVDYTLLSGATVTVDGTTLTEGVDWTAATSNDATATSLASAIDALGTVSASATTNAVTVTAATAGAAGNSIATLTSDAVNLTVSGATLSGGVDGDVDLSAITAGMIVTDSSGANKFTISAADDTPDTVTVTSDPSGSFTPGDDVLIKLPSAVTYKETIINNPSRTSAWYFNHVVVPDLAAAASPGDLITVDPVGHAAGIIARIDSNIQIGGHSHAPAGIRFAGISGITALQLTLSERKDGEPLRLNFINRITSFPGAGNVIYGGYTADSGTSPIYTADEQLIQVMRSLQYIKASLEPGLRVFIWENQGPNTQLQIGQSIGNFLRSNIHLFPGGLPESQQFKVIDVEQTQDDIDKGLLRVRVQVRPNKAVRFIEIALEFPLPTA